MNKLFFKMGKNIKKTLRKKAIRLDLILREDAKREFESLGYHFKPQAREKIKYIKQNYITIYQGYDFLENAMVINKYICQVHKIQENAINTLLYYFPKQYFTYQEYNSHRKNFGGPIIQYLMKEDLIQKIDVEQLVGNKKKRGPLKKYFHLTKKGRTIVMDYYEYLSGAKKLDYGKIRRLKPDEEGYEEQQQEIFTNDLINQFNNLAVSKSRMKAI